MRCPLCEVQLKDGEDLPTHYVNDCVQATSRSSARRLKSAKPAGEILLKYFSSMVHMRERADVPVSYAVHMHCWLA